MTYPGTLSLSRAHLTHLADLLRGHRARIGSRWRRLAPGRQALLVLAHLRHGDTYTRLAVGFEVGLATVFRYVREAVDLLADRAPSLTAALCRLAGNGHRLGVLDGSWYASTDHQRSPTPQPRRHSEHPEPDHRRRNRRAGRS